MSNDIEPNDSESNDIDFSKLMSLLSTIAETVEMESRVPKTPFVDTLSDEDVIDLTTTLYEVADEYLQEHVIQMHEPNFHGKMIDDITIMMFDIWVDADLCSHGLEDGDSDDDYAEVHAFIRCVITDYFTLRQEWDSTIPLRSSCRSSIKSLCISTLSATIDHLRTLPQPTQRTNEWYEFRHQLITASNLGKIFGSEASRNSLIYEKCQPLKQTSVGDSASSTYVNTMSPMHWGQKYEPVSVMVYENMYNTLVEDFGCIQHPCCKCIGASPDGINVDKTSPIYGRMLEIKNIVNRDITGIPLKAYWIQMQVQMETCDLDTCDFLETRFKEYENENEFYSESTDLKRGVILHFIDKISNDTQTYSGAPHYEYMPFDIELSKETIDKWISDRKSSLENSHSLYETLFWKLPEWSCVLVERNRTWFQKARPFIEDTWKTIVKERELGYTHRAPVKRIVKKDVMVGTVDDTNSKTISNLPTTKGVCLVKLDENEEL